MVTVITLFLTTQAPTGTEPDSLSPPALLPASGLSVMPSSGDYILSWKASPTDSLLERYEIYRDDSKIGETRPAELSFTDQGAQGQHSYFVRAVRGSQYVDTRKLSIGQISNFRSKQEWRPFGFAGYYLSWLVPLEGSVEIIRKGTSLGTLPPGTMEFLDETGKLGQRDYAVRDSATGKTIKPNVSALWMAMDFKGLVLSWDVPGADSLTLLRSSGGRPPVPVARVAAKEEGFFDQDATAEILNSLNTRGLMRTYTYYLVSDDGETMLVSPPVEPIWFNLAKMPILVFDILFAAAFFTFLMMARAGRPMFIRKIAGLEELDNAVGRSTELGRPIIYVPGIGTVADIETIASLTILKHVAKKAAQYETPVLMPNFDPLVLAAAKEVVKEAYTEVGRPDLYNEDNVFYVTSEQFAFAAAVSGLMVREKPGATFLVGYYAAEALVIAETGYSVGAIQVAGTASSMQTPFFLAACDYVLIGEEIFAASAYLSRNALQIATLKAEDVFKAVFATAIAVFSLLAGVGFSLAFLG